MGTRRGEEAEHTHEENDDREPNSKVGLDIVLILAVFVAARIEQSVDYNNRGHSNQAYGDNRALKKLRREHLAPVLILCQMPGDDLPNVGGLPRRRRRRNLDRVIHLVGSLADWAGEARVQRSHGNVGRVDHGLEAGDVHGKRGALAQAPNKRVRAWAIVREGDGTVLQADVALPRVVSRRLKARRGQRRASRAARALAAWLPAAGNGTEHGCLRKAEAV
mmetsp:Transcript_22020/g.68578  ORF Transcript_22020/g.68578 Transcript_22020/m.68578 type:complete len:220 (-) Transcript_22020:155-814(-)